VSRTGRGWQLGVVALLGALEIAPWGYAYLEFRADLAITKYMIPSLLYFPASQDWWLVRLFPLPFEVRVPLEGISPEYRGEVLSLLSCAAAALVPTAG
jgi:hypothetical protein